MPEEPPCICLQPSSSPGDCAVCQHPDRGGPRAGHRPAAQSPPAALFHHRGHHLCPRRARWADVRPHHLHACPTSSLPLVPTMQAASCTTALRAPAPASRSVAVVRHNHAPMTASIPPRDPRSLSPARFRPPRPRVCARCSDSTRSAPVPGDGDRALRPSAFLFLARIFAVGGSPRSLRAPAALPGVREPVWRARPSPPSDPGPTPRSPNRSARCRRLAPRRSS